MRNRVEAYFGMLEQLSAEELDRSATEVAVLEKRNVARLIAHICEISRRNVHLACGYKNLFDYGVRRLNLSEGSVWRRLQVAKVCRRFPQVLVALSQNRLNLTAASLLAPHLSEGNHDKTMAAPVTAIVGYDTRFYELLPRLFPHENARAWFEGNVPLIQETAFRNGSLQGAYFILAARALGLDCGPMSGFDRKMVDREFFPDGRIESNFLCNLAYGDAGKLHPRSPRLDFEDACDTL